MKLDGTTTGLSPQEGSTEMEDPQMGKKPTMKVRDSQSPTFTEKNKEI